MFIPRVPPGSLPGLHYMSLAEKTQYEMKSSELSDDEADWVVVNAV